MPADIPGIHHVTAIGSDPRRNLEFYTETLGLRLVKRSVNQDDVSVYHLFYGDRGGNPGTSMTFFPYPDARQGQVGTGQASAVAFLIPDGAVDFWTDRLADAGVDADEPHERFGDTVIPFRDPDGLPLELVARADAPAGDPPEGPVSDEHAIRGFFGVTLSLSTADPTEGVLETMGYAETDSDGSRRRYESDGELGYVVDICEEPQAPRGQPGAGTVHHVAFRTTADDQPEWRTVLQGEGLRPTEIIDRKWFESVYVREHGGVLFEFATKEPGYTVDEDLESLGERLVLPEWLESRRDEIEAGLPDLSLD
ncbi:ring-cleaving dioxygenase [Natrinema versiforme]|uniref:Ring-cleaving dioxygenase n=1 Tax=Natrinema versiforme TaxID=88724 RepID=A0A4V1FZC6_9EURY|nr:ring-cleaving dioxygenase [Natrinema versiforme]QCS41627.1 ring-cleaving dioxygenase [Natrinema versiforme]